MPRRRTVYAWYRYAIFLVKEFRWAMLVFWSMVLIGGLLLKSSATGVAQNLSYVNACYLVFSLVLGQTLATFPSEWYLQILCFAAPIIGLGAIADSVVRLGFFMFTSKRKLPEWHRMNALSMRNHIVLCGIGKVGYRILEELLELGEDVVAIDRNAENPFVMEMIEHGVTTIIGQARSRRLLEEANVKNARAVIFATDDDLANIDAALTAREINPDIRVVIRLFDDTLAS
jgi:hypothetical protein